MNTPQFKLSPTRFASDAEYAPGSDGAPILMADACRLHYGCQFRGDWRFVIEQPAGHFGIVGAKYPTKAELLADLPRYAKETWNFA